MAGFAWPGADPGTALTASALFVLDLSSVTLTGTSTALDPGAFYSSDVTKSTSTASDGGAFFSSDVSAPTTGSHTSTHCPQTALPDYLLNPNVAPPIDVVPSSISYGTLPTVAPKAAGLAFDRGTPFEMSDPTALATSLPTSLSATLIKRDIPRFSTNPGPIIVVVVIVLGVILLLYLSFKYCARTGLRKKDLEKGAYPYYEGVTRGRRRYRDKSPPVTRLDDIPISEGYGTDPVDLARAQNWQESLVGKGVYATRDRVSRGVGADNFQSTSTPGGGNNSAYNPPRFPSLMPTRKLVPKPRPTTQLPVLSYNTGCTIGPQVSPLSANDVRNDRNHTHDYIDISHPKPPKVTRAPSGWL